MRIGAEVYHALRKIIIERYGALSASVGDEGGFAPDLADVAEALELIMAAIKATGHQDDVRIALDVAASELAVRSAVFHLSHYLASLMQAPVLLCAAFSSCLGAPRGGAMVRGLSCIAHILWLCV